MEPARGRETRVSTGQRWLLAVLFLVAVVLVLGCASWRPQRIHVGAAYLQHCDACHAGAAPELFDARWRTRFPDAPALSAAVEQHLTPSHPPHGVSIAESREIRTAIVCHHFPKSRSCRS